MIAEKAGRLVCELEEQLSVDELYEWGAWFELKADTQKKAMDKAKTGQSRGKKWR
jgi:hypothetical protein